MAATLVTLKTRGRLDRVNFRNDYWDCYKMAKIPSSDPRNNIARHISAPDLFSFQKWRMYSLRLTLTPGFFSTRPGREPWERGWSCPLLWLGFTEAPCKKRTQQCWISHFASVCTPTLLHVVGSCCTTFETGQTFIDLQTDATTPNMLGQQWWEFVRSFARSLT